MSLRIPTVDISAYLDDARAGERAGVAEAMGEACAAVGFVQVTGHGIPAATIEALKAAMDAFFALDLEEKKHYRTPPEVNRGYAPPKSESLSLSLGVEAEAKDYFEAFNVGTAASDFPGVELPADDYAENVWPSDVEGFKEAVEAYFAAAGRVARTLTHVFADALDVPRSTFDDVAHHPVNVMRMNNYALPEGEAVSNPTGMGAHSDYGIVTVLWADREPGLQVLHEQRWHDVMPDEDALLVNLGDLMARWTDDRWLSTLHRVVPPVVDGTVRRRRSAAYFHDGDVDALIQTIPGDGEVRYAPISVGDHLRAKLAGSRGGVINTAAGDEARRVLSAQE